MKDVSYKTFIKKKCDCCGSANDLTVHHVVGREFHKYLQGYVLEPRDLKTLCQTCHNDLEAEIDIIKDTIPVDTYYETITRMSSRISTVIDLLQQKVKSKQQIKFIQSVTDSVALYLGKPVEDLSTIELVIPDKWPSLREVDCGNFCKVLRDHYKLYKLKRRVFDAISTTNN